MISISITIEETDSGISCNIEGKPGEDGKKTTNREFAFGKAVSDLLSANSKMIARLSEYEVAHNDFGKHLAHVFKDAAKEVYSVREEEFNEMVKGSKNLDALREKLEAHAKAKDASADDKPAEKEPCDLAQVEESVKEELANLPTNDKTEG